MNELTNPKDLIGITKVNLFTVPPASIVYEALAMQDGARKYGAYNWRTKKVVASIYIAAALRHIYKFLDGLDVDPESGLPELAHAKACLGILIDAKETGNLVDDRPAAGPTARLLEQYRVANTVTSAGSDKK
jgi:hypothetical protein